MEPAWQTGFCDVLGDITDVCLGFSPVNVVLVVVGWHGAFVFGCWRAETDWVFEN